ncbi:MAG TPA: hypothetical protein VMR31_04480 [Myxococcota bacterium]|nr:hypothetical protein [Myxococcota bacterium]
MPTVRFGKHPAKHDYRTLRLKDYFTAALAAPPATFDVLPRVYQNLQVPLSNAAQTLFPIDGNDRLSDCTIAAVAHATTVFCGLVSALKIPSDPAVEKRYFHLTGGTDSGLASLDVLNDWHDHGFSGEKILAFAEIDRKNHAHVKQAIHLFGGVFLGFQVQEACESDFANQKPWTPGPLTKDGHAVFATGYDAHALTVLTWGSTQKATWGWWDECVDEAYAILPSQARNAQFQPGFSLAQLLQDLDQVAGS